ncbi:hypothetical protein D3C77_364140 [compost metagenome]
MLDDLATDAPVGVPVQYHRLSIGLGLGQGIVERGGSGHGLPGVFGPGLEVASTTGDGGLRQRTQRVGLATQCAIPTGQGVDQQQQAEQLRQTLQGGFHGELQGAEEHRHTGTQ